MSLRQTIVRGMAAQVTAQTLKAVSKGLIVLLLTRVFLQPAEYGLLFLALSVLGVAQLFSNLGFAGSVAKYLAEYRETDPSQVRYILRTGLKYNLLAISVVGVALLLAADRIAEVLGEPRLALFLVVGIGYVAFHSIRKFATLSFQGFNRVTWSAVVGAVSSVSLVVFVVSFLFLGFGVIGALLGYVFSSALAAAFGLTVLYRRFYTHHRPAETPESGLSRRVLGYSLPLTMTRGANVLDRRVDTVLIGFFLAPVSVGFYTLGKQITEFVVIPASSLGFTIAPAYGEQKASGNLNRAAQIYESTLKHTVSVYTPAAAGLLLLAEPTIRFIFGADYLGAVPVIQVFSIYVLLRAIDKITNDGLDYLGRARARAVVKGVAAVGNFLLNLVMIPLLGIEGAAIASVLSTTLLVGVEVYIIHVELPISTGRLGGWLGFVGLTTGGMALVVGILQPYITDIVSLLGVVLTGIVVWAALATVTGLLDAGEVRSAFG